MKGVLVLGALALVALAWHKGRTCVRAQMPQGAAPLDEVSLIHLRYLRQGVNALIGKPCQAPAVEPAAT